MLGFSKDHVGEQYINIASTNANQSVSLRMLNLSSKLFTWHAISCISAVFKLLSGSKGGDSKDFCAVLDVHLCIFKHGNSIVQALVIMAAWILLNFGKSFHGSVSDHFRENLQNAEIFHRCVWHAQISWRYICMWL